MPCTQLAREPRPQHSMRLCCAPVVVRKRLARLLSELGQRLLRRKACHGSGADRLSPHRQLGLAVSITNHTAAQQRCRDDAKCLSMFRAEPCTLHCAVNVRDDRGQKPRPADVCFEPCTCCPASRCRGQAAVDPLTLRPVWYADIHLAKRWCSHLFRPCMQCRRLHVAFSECILLCHADR
jgi:hypothetical protein